MLSEYMREVATKEGKKLKLAQAQRDYNRGTHLTHFTQSLTYLSLTHSIIQWLAQSIEQNINSIIDQSLTYLLNNSLTT